MKVDVHHLTRVEGHGNIVIDVKNGIVKKCQWQVPEAPRFFEAMVRDRHYSEVARITSRICGICSVGHTLASVKASEAALGIDITEQTRNLRKLLKHAENFDSHILHIFFLVAPDLLGAPSVFPLVEKHGPVVAMALRLKRLGHEWGALIGGRTTHPTTVVPGGFTKLPTEIELRELRAKILAHEQDLVTTADLVLSLAGKIPNFNRPTEYIALSSDDDYELYSGEIKSTLYDGSIATYKVADYRSVTNEYLTPQSTAKWTKNRHESYAAGALARFNNNYDKLHEKALAVATKFGLKPICTNPFMNSVAQLVEVVNDVYQSVALIDQILKDGIKDEPLVRPTKFSKGAGAVEVPRGILFHEYEYDKDGMCISGNCIIPTNQNHANIQKDFEALLPFVMNLNYNNDEIKLAFEMLVRAYDPCISCSTHYLDIIIEE
ncbi:MAG: hydrogenase/sulfur reductase subunit alpha [Bdellovibrionales bacterium RIFOXYD12_FULL_39_22]|nr:MAG: hydrogenase/sulfur reductase subunit alpha [Bdellovibrionales bacterium RIFOXYB1_FULL_39_21]OFZ42542.1 MAG: hydrogenase/sulfur reductase subunit alpha [Bdellovibrionales bacterium RIFOXYC12_FULL_39_17]OFZ45821.1 MAG: hydrogenase/sulfur reductase subunit alpha [Bdellovibrionales bacterium RIFOXYC1_FULL_39_130]OFZ74754.1 MAG: hydrogenase/sulfur reductase subunit alpha [Bdellovibrionales bacterium RIFOXYD1_FULL_39_84]OFZ93133.1 MAG: hydrogenase/sulfur reductase subunit alpha [Bdellovibrion